MAADEGGRPTLETVAARAGVSRATVSRVVNGSTTVAPEIRARVGAALRELGYVPHGAARTLAGRRSDTAAIVVCEPDSRVFDDPWLGEFVRGARAELTASGLHPVLLLAPDPAEQERCAAYLAGARVTGALVLSPHDGHPLPGLLRRPGVPTVLSGRPAEADAGLAYVDVDNRAAAERAVRWPSAEMGRALARLLLAGRGGADALVFPTRLVVRGSA